MRILIIQSNTVIDVIRANSVADVANSYPTCIVVAGPNPDPLLVGPGFTTTDNGKTFQAPLPPAAPSGLWSVTKYAFMQRFTANEAIQFYTSAQGTGLTAAESQYFLDLLRNASYINLNDNATIQLVNTLVSANILNSDRANTILTTPAAANEKVGGV